MTPTDPQPDPVELQLRAFFEDNYQRLRGEGGRHLGPDVLESALQQVLAYWRKLRDIAERVTETEVKLTLSDQTTPAGRKFGIEGVVDIVREDDRVIMYDLKTHDAEFVRANTPIYAGQLNVYAFIWQTLRGNRLDQTSIISTALPRALRDAISAQDHAAAATAMEKWEPVIDIPFDQSKLQEMTEAFAVTVDKIEDHNFRPPGVLALRERAPGQRFTFAASLCRNCDARFSCSSYRAFSLKAGVTALRDYRQYFQETLNETEQETWINAGLLSDADKLLDEFEA